MGEDRLPYRHHPKRLKPSLQQALYHAKQPVLTLLAGTVIALAINFSLAQVHLSQNNSVDTATSNPAVLDSFDIKTNPENKQVDIILHRQASKQSLDVHSAKKGNQYTLTIENTQLSQQMVDSGLPVVIDNQNKLIGRAVPGKTVNQSKIIIPNLPSHDDYQVLVYEQQPGQSPRLLSGGESRSVAASYPALHSQPQQHTVPSIFSSPMASTPNKPRTIAVNTAVLGQQEQQPSTPSIVSSPGFTRPVATNTPTPKAQRSISIASSTPAINTPSINTPTETPLKPAAKALRKIAPVVAQTIETPKPQTEFIKPRTEKVAANTYRPTPRSAVPSLEGHFDTVTSSSTNLHTAPLASLPQSQESFALASIAKNPSPTAASASIVKRPIQIVENKIVPANDISIRPKNLAPLSNTILPETTVKPQTVTDGSITYIPPFSGKGASRNGLQHGPLWNPYVVKVQTQEQQQPKEQNSAASENIALSHIPPLQTVAVSNSAPSPDPLWYLHNLPNSGHENVSLQPLPDLSNGLPATNPTLSPATATAPTLASGTIQIDNRFIKTLKQTLLNLPVWFYIIFGLFFGGIGLFATLGAVFIMQQLWINAKRPIIQINTETKASQEPVEAPKVEPIFNTEAVQFQDSTNTELRQYLEQNRAWDQQQQVKNAVKKSVLIHFPSQRAGNKAKSGQPSRKASHLLL